MARKSPVELQKLALGMLRAGHEPVLIADLLGLHRGAVNRLLIANEYHCPPRRQTMR